MVGALRQASRRYPPHYKMQNQHKDEYFIKTKTGKPMRRVRYKCMECKEWYSSKDIRRDHIEPVVAVTGMPRLPNGKVDWNVYIERLLCPPEGLQLLCKGCHDLKTANENKLRKSSKKE